MAVVREALKVTNVIIHGGNPDAVPNRFYANGVVARLALLGASLELERTAPAA